MSGLGGGGAHISSSGSQLDELAKGHSLFFSSLRKLVRSRNFKNVTSVPRRQKDPGFMSMVKQPGEALPQWRQAGHVVGALRTEGLVGSWP